jgi:hypothetical protein
MLPNDSQKEATGADVLVEKGQKDHRQEEDYR